ncbi:MAG TPA: thioredoxin family protein [Ideonella sp.]|jgi:hypothetical protein|nr:thioredoxin family protein [Ideonella sp.]
MPPLRPADHPAAEAEWLVACLCAAWCRTCDDYRQVMAEAARAHPGLRFVWVDIEDHAAALDDPQGAADDIEDFPTLLIARHGEAHFFGTVTPHPGVLARLVEQAAAGALPALADAAARRMARAVTALAHEAPGPLRVS